MTKTVDQVQIGDAVFDPDSGELSVHGDRSKLRPQTARVLTVLVEREGSLVSKADLLNFGQTLTLPKTV